MARPSKTNISSTRVRHTALHRGARPILQNDEVMIPLLCIGNQLAHVNTCGPGELNHI